MESSHPGPARDTSPYWSDSASFPTFAGLDGDGHADVVVIGGGITGLTAAYLLASAGKSVVLLERNRCAHVDSGHTSAHLTMVTDERLTDLAAKYGRDHAQAVWDAGLAAIAEIEAIARRHDIACDFEWVDGYLHAPLSGSKPEDAGSLKQEAELAGALGFDTAFIDDVPLVGGPGIRFDAQARFHPRKYLAGLARAFASAGGRIHEHSAVDGFSRDPIRVTANKCDVRCDNIVVATHNPLAGLASTAGATLVPDEARALHELRDRGACLARCGPGCPLLGHRHALPLPEARASSRPRCRHFRRRGPQDRPGGRYARMLRASRAGRSRPSFRSST